MAQGLEVIANTLSRGSEILKRLRSLVSECAEEPVARVDVSALVREVVALADPLICEAEARCARIEVDQRLGGVPPVVGRPSELLEVFLNLVVNAIEGMPKGGVLALENRSEGADVSLVQKPIRLPDLLGTVRNALAKRTQPPEGHQPINHPGCDCRPLGATLKRLHPSGVRLTEASRLPVGLPDFKSGVRL